MKDDPAEAAAPGWRADRSADDGDLRLRAAWLYYAHGLTQQAVSDRLGVSRSKVLRLLDEVRARQEVRIWIAGGPSSAVAQAIEIEDRFGVDRVIVVPGGGDAGSGTAAVGMALGRELATLIDRPLTIGVGWGRTLHAALPAFAPPVRRGGRVVSMLGGSVDPGLAQAFEFPWRLAGRLGAACQLMPAPVLVASEAVRRSLLEESGMGAVMALGRELDMAVYSVGDVGAEGTTLARHLVGAEAYAELVARGAVADVLCRFIDADGRDVAHETMDRLLALPLDDLRRAKARVLAAAGSSRARAIAAAIRRTRPTLLIVDEAAARGLRELG